MRYQNTTPEVSPVRDDLMSLDKKSKFYHFFEFIKRAYGSDIEKILKAINSILLLGLSLKFIKNKILRAVLKILQAIIPAALFGSEFYLKFKNYIDEIKENTSSLYDKNVKIILKILDIEENEEQPNPLVKYDFHLSTEVMLWIFSKPKTSAIKIINFFDMDGKEIKDFNLDEIDKVKSLYILTECEEFKFLWFVRIIGATGTFFIEEAIAILENDNSGIEKDYVFDKIKKEIIRDFIYTLDCKKNILKFDSIGGIRTYPRIKVIEKINQFNVKKLLKEISNVLKLGRRRAYGLVGRQGTGKSTILRKIGELATNYIVIYISPEDFNTSSRIKDRFELIRILGKCIIIIEDLDGYDFEEKNARATTFLNEIDDVNDNLNAVIIVTINETNKIHKSIIDRPGRFDRIIEIKPPTTKTQIYEILSSKFNKLKPVYCPRSKFKLPNIKDIKYKLIDKCISEKFTQAEIANAIMEQIFLDSKDIIESNNLTWDLDSDFFNKRFEEAINTHMATKKAIENSNFSFKEVSEITENIGKDMAASKSNCPV